MNVRTAFLAFQLSRVLCTTAGLVLEALTLARRMLRIFSRRGQCTARYTRTLLLQVKMRLGAQACQP